eukprot:6887084-Prymnesium_polylepis.1
MSKNRTSPTRTTQAGVAVPDGPACTSPPPCSMPPRWVPHERHVAHCPPSQSPAHRAARAERCARTKAGPRVRQRRRRRRPLPALNTAPPGSRR